MNLPFLPATNDPGSARDPNDPLAPLEATDPRAELEEAAGQALAPCVLYDIRPPASPATAQGRYGPLFADLLPEREALHETFAALAAERAARPDEPATALVLRYRDARGALVTRGRVTFHEGEVPHTFVLGSHPRCDFGPLPGARSRDVVLVCRGPEPGSISPRADIFALHRDACFGLPSGAEVSLVPERQGRLGHEGTPLSFAFGNVIAWVVQVSRGEPLRAPYTPAPPDTPEMRAAALEAVRVRQAVDAALVEAGADPHPSARHRAALGRQAALRDSLLRRPLPGEEGLAPPEAEPDEGAAMSARLATRVGIPVDPHERAAAQGSVDVWLDDVEWEDVILLGRAAPHRISADMQAHADISREHAAILPLGEELWLIDLASTHGTILGRAGGPQVELEGAERIQRLREGDELWLGEHPVEFRRG